MTKVGHFRFSSDILRRLGEELNPSADQGILELVKNAYDADAKKCIVSLHATDQAGGSITIADSGDGMDESAITNGWLVLGSSLKSKDKLTRLGRVPAGSKGLGRLAALRLGETVSLVTIPRSDRKTEFSVEINWPAFDKASLVDEVDIPIVSRPNRGGSRGTNITISRLKSAIRRTDVKKLARSLILLADPFGDDPSGFLPTLIAPDFKDLEALVAKRYFDNADYWLVATIDQRGRASAEVRDWRGEVLFTAKHSALSQSRGGSRYQCPSARFDFWTFLLTNQSFLGRSVSLTEVRHWLEHFGGVHVYHNGLRVAPYGNPGNDWLDINLQRSRSPEERPSTNNSIGKVSLTDKEEILVQKTDRSGFIENEAFGELREFARNALDWMARRRLDVAESKRQKGRAVASTRSEKARERVEEAIESAPRPVQKNITAAFVEYDRLRERENEALRKEVQLYRTLGTAGITTATLAHESRGNPIKVISQSIKSIKHRLLDLHPKSFSENFADPVERVVTAVRALGVLSSTTLDLIMANKRRVGRVDIHKTIQHVFELFEPFLDRREIVSSLALASRSPYLRGTEAAIESIIVNLINNSITAFEGSGKKQRRIAVSTELVDSTLVLSFADNGPGIENIGVKEIWLPGVTTRPNGTGLGLTIVRDAVVDLGGNVAAEPHGHLGGAEFRLELPVIGA